MENGLQLYNTLTRKKENFEPLNGHHVACTFAGLLFIVMCIWVTAVPSFLLT